MSYFRKLSFLLATFFIAILLICGVGCSKKNINGKIQDGNIEVLPDVPAPKWSVSDTRIVILFGYGYNDPSFIDSTKAILSEEFGLAEDNGLISILIYPENFKVGDAERISMLPDLIADIPISGLIILGAPERTHVSLGKFQDLDRTWPVFSFFAQDDILGIEAGSDFVLDYAPAKNMDAELLEEAVVELSSDLPQLLIEAITVIKNIKTVPVPTSDLKNMITTLAGTTWNISEYIDPETGLKSLNHFIVERK